MIEHLCKGLNARVVDGPQGKPLGRRAVCIQIKDRYLKHIDLSIMPRITDKESPEVEEYLKVMAGGSRAALWELGRKYGVSEYDTLPMACGVAQKVIYKIKGIK